MPARLTDLESRFDAALTRADKKEKKENKKMTTLGTPLKFVEKIAVGSRLAVNIVRSRQFKKKDVFVLLDGSIFDPGGNFSAIVGEYLSSGGVYPLVGTVIRAADGKMTKGEWAGKPVKSYTMELA